MTASFTWGAHNLHDDAGIPTMFADAVIFTEAIPHTIEDDLGTGGIRDRAKRAAARAKLRATGHAVIVCRQQPDLVFVARRRLFKTTGRSYTQYVKGVPKVTPNRGTFVVFTEHRETGTKIAFIGEHRINAAFPPFIRGEGKFRHAAWGRHTSGTWETIQRLATSWMVCAGGDDNTPHGVRAYPSCMSERGESLDRLATTAHIGSAEYRSRKGSDHPRILARITWRP